VCFAALYVYRGDLLNSSDSLLLTGCIKHCNELLECTRIKDEETPGLKGLPAPQE
jgi:hypothetical protein